MKSTPIEVSICASRASFIVLTIVLIASPCEPYFEMSDRQSPLYRHCLYLNLVRINQKRQQTRCRLFETGLRFIPKSSSPVSSLSDLTQQRVLGGIASGALLDEQWAVQSVPLDFYHIKADVEALLQLTQDRFYPHSGRL